MADKKVNDAAWTLLTSFQEANRIVAEHLVASQERSRKLAEEFFTEGMEVLRANQQAVAESVAAQERSVQYTQEPASGAESDGRAGAHHALYRALL